MEKLTITITITDPEILELYGDTHEEIIIEDFIECPAEWLDGAEIEVVKE
jgi:hypothetical protein